MWHYAWGGYGGYGGIGAWAGRWAGRSGGRGQREVLEQLVRTHSTPQQLAMRARLILHAADAMGVTLR